MTKLELASSVMLWWQYAQFWCDDDSNVFYSEPDFVVNAKEALSEEGYSIDTLGNIIAPE